MRLTWLVPCGGRGLVTVLSCGDRPRSRGLWRDCPLTFWGDPTFGPDTRLGVQGCKWRAIVGCVLAVGASWGAGFRGDDVRRGDSVGASQRRPTSPPPPTRASAKVSWTAPSTNGTAITSYTVTSSPTAKTCTTTGTTDCTVTGLANGDKYTFKVPAHNGKGTGATSTPSNTVIPTSVPGKPTGISVTSENAAVQGRLDRRRPTTAHPSPSTRSPAHRAAKTCTTTGSSHLHSVHLTNGTPYTFKVHATNGRGTGPTSTPSASVVPASPPTTAPTITGTSSGNESITLDWKPVTPGKDGGAHDHRVRHPRRDRHHSQGHDDTSAATATTATVSGLINGNSVPGDGGRREQRR